MQRLKSTRLRHKACKYREASFARNGAWLTVGAWSDHWKFPRRERGRSISVTEAFEEVHLLAEVWWGEYHLGRDRISATFSLFPMALLHIMFLSA